MTLLQTKIGNRRPVGNAKWCQNLFGLFIRFFKTKIQQSRLVSMCPHFFRFEVPFYEKLKMATLF